MASFRIAMAFALATALTLPALSASARRPQPAGDVEMQELRQEIQQVRQAISAEELLQALDLDKQQAAALMDAIAEARAERDGHRSEALARGERQLALLDRYHTELMADGSPSADTEAELRSFREGIRDDRAQRRADRGNGGGLRDSLANILTETQSETLQNFRPMRAGEEPGMHRQRSEGQMARGHQGEGSAETEASGERPNRRQQRHGMRLRGLVLSDAFVEALSSR